MSQAGGWQGWCIIELMGHRRLSGYLSEQTIGGASFLRLDIPEAGGRPATTQFYSGSAVYCITPTSEEIARGLAARNYDPPVSRFELPAPKPSREDSEPCVFEFCGSCGRRLEMPQTDPVCDECREGWPTFRLAPPDFWWLHLAGISCSHAKAPPDQLAAASSAELANYTSRRFDCEHLISRSSLGRG